VGGSGGGGGGGGGDRGGNGDVGDFSAAGIAAAAAGFGGSEGRAETFRGKARDLTKNAAKRQYKRLKRQRCGKLLH